MEADQRRSEEKTFQQDILEAEHQIGQAISELSRLETVLEDICYEIQTQLGFDFVGVSLVSLEQHTIEAVYGVGIAKGWAGRAKHFLEQDPVLRDIQADIVQTQQTEVISGWDERFDRGIYDEFEHDQLIRLYMPILLIQDETGKVIQTWQEQWQWQKSDSSSNSANGQRTIFKLNLPNFLTENQQVIGTIEAGYQNLERLIEASEVAALAEILFRRVLDIRKAQLPWVLEVIAESAMRIMEAEAATLHFLYEADRNHYVYEVFSGELGQRFLRACPPREEGLGRQAIREGQCRVVPKLPHPLQQQEMQAFNLPAYQAGVRALAAFPLKIDATALPASLLSTYSLGQEERHKEGVLYVNFQNEHPFTAEELRWGEIFANRAVDAIRQATLYQQTRDTARQLSNLHSVAQSFAHMPDKGVLLRHIAWEALNILAADMITIYEYIQTERQFMTPPAIAGKLKHIEAMEAGLEKHHVPVKLVKQGENVYLQQVSDSLPFAQSAFTQRESVQSVAGILLRVNEEIVGVMFINYRRSHYFIAEERQLIETLASYAATAIKNQRWLNTMSEIDRQIITTLDQAELLSLIVQRSVQLTGADFGMIRMLEPGQRLITLACYPVDELESGIPTSIEEGITGWVAMHRKSALVRDVQADPRYRSGFPEVRSELCVPLLDSDRMLGVLNVESRQVDAFTRRDLLRMETFADRVVIGIQNIKNKNRLVNIKTMTKLGDLAAPLVHRMNNDVGAIRVTAQDIVDSSCDDIQDAAAQIVASSTRVLQETNRMKTWIQEQPCLIELHQAIDKAVQRLNIPAQISCQIVDLTHLPRVWGSEQQLTNVFDNLIQNAIDAMPDGGRVFIVETDISRDLEEWVEVQVCDTGVGIPTEYLDQIFQPNFTTKAQRRGMGFGLWWARFYVESLNGFLIVESVLGKGTRFTVRLPTIAQQG